MNAEQIKAIVQGTFNAVADGYDDPTLRFFPACAKQLADLLDLRGDERVLDVATGTGHAALELAARLPRGRAMGVDFSAGMLAQARRKAAARGVANVEFAEMDMLDLRFEGQPFDAALCSFGIFFVEDMETAWPRSPRKSGRAAASPSAASSWTISAPCGNSCWTSWPNAASSCLRSRGNASPPQRASAPCAHRPACATSGSRPATPAIIWPTKTSGGASSGTPASGGWSASFRRPLSQNSGKTTCKTSPR